ncbi:MAG: hypothetical protein C0456_02825 [Hyphomonas sp.]|uniref:GIY-YIG nuclease family protein n=1 Tax=Hyphomonas sp. TaxID=87 RepID=UPI001DBCD21F|nr:hypothetical protein [Hyphomonas sp.]
MRFSYVYILASKRNGTLYTGVTSDLIVRVWQHKEDLLPGFSSKYGCKRLVWFETHDDIEAAIRKEKQIKRWRRAWKLRLIEETNPAWCDLWDDLNAVPEGAILPEARALNLSGSRSSPTAKPG